MNLKTLGDKINSTFEHAPTSEKLIESMCSDITDGIYNSCNKSRHTATPVLPPLQQNCGSANFKAIADANLAQWKRLRNTDTHAAEHYHAEWLKYLDAAMQKEKEEMSSVEERKWKYLIKNDTRKFWKMIDWKGCPNNKPENIPPNKVYTFFKNIFQSPILTNIPSVEERYDTDNEITLIQISQ